MTEAIRRVQRGIHPLIEPDSISDLVDGFYADIRIHPRLGPIFNKRLEERWPRHIDKLKSFWRSVLLTSGEYNGRPVPAHNNITELEEVDFSIWLALFDTHVDRHFGLEARAIIKEKAHRIAKSLWYARFGTLYNNPPGWSVAASTSASATG